MISRAASPRTSVPRSRGPSRAHPWVAAALAALSIACGARSERVVRLPVPVREQFALGSESRTGVWLSPGDAVHWSLAAGPARRLTAAYASALAGSPAGTIRIRVSGGAGRSLSQVVAVASDPSRWHPLLQDVPRSREKLELEIAYDSPGPGSELRSLFLCEPSFSAPASARPRTIVLFDVDSLRADRVGAYGYVRPTTPHLDRWFREGLRAEKCIAAANWTLPAHASMFTSASVARHDAGRYSMALADDLDTLAASVAAAGYRTVAVTGGGFVEPSFGLARGFDRYVSAKEPAADAVRRSLDILKEQGNEPVFLFFHTYQLHEYLAEESAARDLFGGVSALGPDWRLPLHEFATVHSGDPAYPGWARNRYDAALRSVDAAFGGLLAGLERQGRLDDAAILFTSDHGEGLCDRLNDEGACLSLGHASPFLFEEELLVPFELRVPWKPKRRGVVRGNASELDVAPTLLDAAGAKIPAGFEGVSLLSSDPPPHRALVSEAPPLEALAVHIDQHKLIRRTGVPQRFWNDGPDFAVFNVQESFDLSKDPGERKTLASASDWGQELLAAVDRYLASGFPDALVVRLPRVPEQEGRTIVVSARGRGAAPSIRSFGLAGRGVVTRRGSRTEIRFRRTRAPVWIAFQPDDSRALALSIDGAGPAASPTGRPIAPGSYSWSGLGWAERDRLPAHSETVVFTTPRSARRASARGAIPPEVVKQLLSLGYLPLSAPQAELRPAGRAEDPDANLSPGEIRIDRAD